MKLSYRGLIYLCICYSMYYHSYAIGSPKSIAIGERVPDIHLNKLLNYSKSSALLSSFKDKLLILDFMATNCSSCIESLSRFEKLQKAFDRVQVIVVTDETEVAVKNFLSRSVIGKNLSIPFVLQTPSLRKHFPFQFISHLVWISPDGIVKAVTESEYVNEQNIRALLENRELHLPVKKDHGNFSYKTNLLQPSEPVKAVNIDASPPMFNVFTKHLEGVLPRVTMEVDSVHQLRRYAAVNMGIISVYLDIFGKDGDFPVSQVLIMSRDTSRFYYKKSAGYRSDWEKNNTFCYEAVYATNIRKEELLRRMKSDLDFYLGLDVRMENRLIKGWKLAVDSTAGISLEKDSIGNAEREGEYLFTSTSALVSKLNQMLYGQPVIDSAGQVDQVYWISKNTMVSITLLQKVLERYHLKLVPEDISTEMLVVSDNP